MNKKKLLALLMALVMTLSLMPVTALAEESVGEGQNPIVGPGPNPDIFSSENVAKIGTIEYPTLADAIAAANASGNCTITILQDVDFSSEDLVGYKWAGSTFNPLRISATGVTLDLNGHKFYNMGNCAIEFGSIFSRDGTIASAAIKNGTLEAGKTSGATNSYVLLLGGVDNVTISNITTNGGINACAGTNATISDCVVNGTKYYAVCAQTGSDVTIENSTITKNTDSSVASKAMFWVQGDGTDSDCITSSNPTGAFGASSITIKSGSCTVNSTNGGVFLASGINPVINGGTFNVDPSTFLSNNAAAYYDVTNNAWVVTTPILAAKAVAARFGSEVYNHCGKNVADVETPADYFISLSSKPAYVGETATEIDLSVGSNSHIKENDFAADGMKVAWPVVLFNETDDNDSAAITSTKVNGTTYTTLTDNGNNNYTVVQDYDHYGNPYIGFGIEGTSSTDVLVTRKVNTLNQTVSTSYGVTTPDAPSTTGGSNYGIWTYWPGYNKTIDQVREMDGQTLDYSIYNTTTGKTAVVHLTFDCKPVPTPVAQIGATEYTSLADAVSHATAGQTITLLSDIDLTETVNIDKNLTIDLNGNDITATNARALWVKSGDVTITGQGTISANGNSLSAGSSVIRVGDGSNSNSEKRAEASLTIGQQVTVESAKCYGVSVFGVNNTGLELTVNGTINVTGEGGAVANNGNSWNTATTMTINGTVTSANSYAIYHPGKGTLTVNGTVEGKGGIEAKSGTVTIADNAHVTATAAEQSHVMNNNGASTSGYAIAAVSNTGYVGDPTVIINSNDVFGKVIMLVDGNADLNAVVKGSAYDVDPADGFWWKYDETSNVHVLTEVINEATEPTWQWRVINGEWKAVATYKTAAGSYVVEIYEADGFAESQGTITYTAYDDYGHGTTKSFNRNFTVYYDQDPQQVNTVFEWGDVCTLKANSDRDWYIVNGEDEAQVAAVTDTYTFAVTGDVTIRSKEVTGNAEARAIVYATMKSTESGKAEFQAKWSIPKGASVQSVTIYRGYTSADKTITANTLITKGTRYDANLNVLNGDFLLRLTGLTSNTYQHAVIVIKYKVDNKVETLQSEVLKQQVA